jgi:hypothetical protein
MNLPSDKTVKPLGLLGNDPREFASAAIGKKIITTQVERMAELLQETLTKFNLKN